MRNAHPFACSTFQKVCATTLSSGKTAPCDVTKGMAFSCILLGLVTTPPATAVTTDSRGPEQKGQKGPLPNQLQQSSMHKALQKHYKVLLDVALQCVFHGHQRI